MMTLPSGIATAVRSLTGADVSSASAWWVGAERREPDAAGPPANRRLTALTGAVVLPLAVLALLTGLYFGSLWHIHYFVGYLLLPVVLLKIGSTAYRMARYYLRSGLYRLVRPPYPLARITSPVLVLSVVVLFVSGISMWLLHTQADPWGWLHTDAAILFSCIAALHLAMYLPEALHAARDEVVPAPPAAPVERSRRRLALGIAVLVGLALALGTIGFSQQPARAHRFRRGQPDASAGASGPVNPPANP